jgi:flagellar M-ring protein FliF
MEQLKRILAGLTWRQRITILAVAIAVIGGLAALTRWTRERDFQPLYTGLTPEDAGAVLTRLRESGVDYRLGDSGTTVLAPSARVAELRLQLAAAGLPKSGRIGFELFDKTNFGATEFAEQVNYHRALEGELERSITGLAEVEQARVHLTFAKESVFAEQRQPAKASVLIKLRPGVKLSPQSVHAISYLTASAVQGLSPEAVSVVDMRGNLLNRPKRAQTPDGAEAPDAMLDFRQQVERDLLAKVAATLDPLLGPEKYRAGIFVECDFTSGEQSEESFDPARSVMTVSQRTEDISGVNAASGVPGTASNLPRPTSRPGTSASGVTRRTENTSYQTSRVVKRTKLPQGAIKRLSAAVLVDYVARWQGEGAQAKRMLDPVPAEKLKVIRDLVSAAVGLSTARGDQLTVECLPFESTLAWEPPAPPAAPKAAPAPNLPAWLQRLVGGRDVWVWALGGAAVMLLVVLAGILLLARRLSRRARAEAAAAAPLAGGGTTRAAIAASDDAIRAQMEATLAEQEALREKATAEALNSLKLPQVTTKKAEVLTRHLLEGAKKDPAATAQLVRTWLNEGEV